MIRLTLLASLLLCQPAMATPAGDTARECFMARTPRYDDRTQDIMVVAALGVTLCHDEFMALMAAEAPGKDPRSMATYLTTPTFTRLVAPLVLLMRAKE